MHNGCWARINGACTKQCIHRRAATAEPRHAEINSRTIKTGTWKGCAPGCSSFGGALSAFCVEERWSSVVVSSPGWLASGKAENGSGAGGPREKRQVKQNVPQQTNDSKYGPRGQEATAKSRRKRRQRWGGGTFEAIAAARAKRRC